MRKSYLYASLVIILLTLIVWAISNFVQPILPPYLNNALILFFIAFLAVTNFLANFANILEIFNKDKKPGKILPEHAKQLTNQPNNKALEVQVDLQPEEKVGLTSIVMNKGRHHHMATLLSDGDVLVVGGFDYSLQEVLSSAELFHPTNQIFIMIGKMSTRRYFSAAVLMPENLFLILGGVGEQGEVLESVELYKHQTKSFSMIGRMQTPRRGHLAILLQNGKVLVAGGTDNIGTILTSAEIYDPVQNIFKTTGKMSLARLTEHTPNIILLRDGRVMIAGGYDGVKGELASIEIYDPLTETFTDGGNMAVPRAGHTMTLLDSKVLIVGGYNEASGHLKSAELYDPKTKGTILLQETLVPHFHHTATLLPNGNVVVVGGFSKEIELFNADSQSFSTVGSLKENRYLHVSVLLKDGRLAIIGGTSGSQSLNSVEFLKDVNLTHLPSNNKNGPTKLAG